MKTLANIYFFLRRVFMKFAFRFSRRRLSVTRNVVYEEYDQLFTGMILREWKTREELELEIIDDPAPRNAQELWVKSIVDKVDREIMGELKQKEVGDKG